ncbi:MAG: hypothetical protein K8S97_10755, partial [Anaerolineae bacterium]|nr:hypothetical protein [Anaerolineae bacterium]
VRRWGVGRLCKHDNPVSIAAALRAVLDPVTQTELRANIRAAQAEFSETREAEKLCALYREVLRE